MHCKSEQEQEGGSLFEQGFDCSYSVDLTLATSLWFDQLNLSRKSTSVRTSVSQSVGGVGEGAEVC